MKRKAPKNRSREQAIQTLRDAGWTLEKIGRKFAISRQRVHQIIVLNQKGRK